MPTYAVQRKLHIEDRVAEQQALATIKKNPILALVELITNSDDSYLRLESRGQKTDGRIIIELVRKHEGSTIRVIDYAEGFDAERMDERVGGYGGDTSGFTEESAGRGYWGRGLKEAMIAMGFGSVESVRDDFYHKCTLENLAYKRTPPIKVNRKLRGEIGIAENGTAVLMKVVRDGIRIPQYETLKHSLEFYHSLRNIMTSDKREVLLIEKDSRNKIKRQEKLSYILPKGELHSRIQIVVPGYDKAKVELEIFRATEPLSGYEEEGPLRENGLLVCSKGAIVDITLSRKFEGNIYASKVYGRAACDYIDYLLRVEKEPIVHSNRAGLDWTHPFCKAFDAAISKEMTKFVQEEEKRTREEEKKLENEKTRKRYLAALPALNDIAKDELGSQGGSGRGTDGPGLEQLPPNGFDFMPEYVQVVVDKESQLTLKALVPKVVPSGSTVKIKSDVKEIIVQTDEVLFDEKDADPNTGVVVARIKVLGRQVGAEGIITAEVGGLKTEILVKVISRKPEGPHIPREKGGLIKDIEYSAAADPNQRVKFDRNTGKIIIATRAQSVAIYFGPAGEGQDEGHCQVMLAELVVEAFCREVARKKIEAGEPFLGEASEAMNVIHNRLINKYASKIHAMLVQPKFQRKV